MKKMKSCIVIILAIIFLLTTSSNIYAEEIEEPKVQRVEITSPISGDYETGQIITFVVTFDKDITGIYSSDILKIGFNESVTKRTISSGNVNQNTITYQYALQSEDKGTIALSNYTAAGMLNRKSYYHWKSRGI